MAQSVFNNTAIIVIIAPKMRYRIHLSNTSGRETVHFRGEASFSYISSLETSVLLQNFICDIVIISDLYTQCAI